MFTLNTLSLLALAGSALAAPAPVANPQDVHVVYETVVYTVVADAVTVQATPAPVSTRTRHHWSHKASTTPVVVAPSSAAAPSSKVVVETPTPVVTPTPVETPAASSAAASAAPTATGYMSIVNEWRAKLGLKDLVQDSSLEANDLKCLQANPGSMVHILNSGSFAQVLAPGGPNDFEHVFVGGWLCEKPDMAGMDGICATQSSGWVYDSTGHADILTSPNYSKIGCSNSDGIWGCDLA